MAEVAEVAEEVLHPLPRPSALGVQLVVGYEVVAEVVADEA